jgi:hypothetical protein
MISAMDPRSAARILDLADESARPRGSRSRAFAGFALILALAAHGAATSGSPRSAQTAAMSPAGATTAHAARAGESPEMKRLMAIGAAAAMTAGASAQDAVQWRVEDGGNWHWYSALRLPKQPEWLPAKSAAEARGAHLATLTNAGENQFVFQIAVAQGAFEVIKGPYLGARKNADGAFEWITGEPFSFTSWRPGEPSSGNWEPYLNFLGVDGAPAPLWNDTDSPETEWSMIEWSADCNADGLVDYGQIRAGQLADANGNNIPDCCENGGSCCPGDTNNDQSVDGIDLATVLTRWGMPGAKFPQADCNGDGVIDGSDLAIVLAGWGGCP